jgi:hypothetical protein
MKIEGFAGVCSRRRAVQCGAGAVFAIAWLAALRRADAAKLAKSAVQYVDIGAVAGKDCDDCSQFVPGAAPDAAGSCRIVEGAISPHGHCIAFTPKPRA